MKKSFIIAAFSWLFFVCTAVMFAVYPPQKSKGQPPQIKKTSEKTFFNTSKTTKSTARLLPSVRIAPQTAVKQSVRALDALKSENTKRVKKHDKAKR